jgi:hypothetical protein
MDRPAPWLPAIGSPSASAACTLWLPELNDPEYRARIAAECRRLSVPTPDEEVMAAAHEQNAAETPGWR